MEKMFEAMSTTDDYFFKKQLTDLSFWYPILQDLGVPTPETYIIKHKLNLMTLLDGIPVEGLEKLVDDIDYFAQKVGYPCFLRTGQSSDKHGWKDTCHLEKKEDIVGHLVALQEHSCMADMFHPWSMDTIVVRKMLETKPFFVHFH